MMSKDLYGFYSNPKSLKKGLLLENIIIILVLLISISISPFFTAWLSKEYDGVSDNIIICKRLTWQETYEGIKDYSEYCKYIDKAKEEGDYYTSNIDGESYILNINHIDLVNLVHEPNPYIHDFINVNCFIIDDFQQINNVFKIKNFNKNIEIHDNEIVITKNFLEENNLEEKNVINKTFLVDDVELKVKAIIDFSDQLNIFASPQNSFCLINKDFVTKNENVVTFRRNPKYIKRASTTFSNKNTNLVKDANMKYKMYNDLSINDVDALLTKNDLTQDIIDSSKTTIQLVKFVIYSFNMVAIAMFGFFTALKLILKRDELYMRRLIGMSRKEEFALLMLSFNIYILISLVTSLLIYSTLFIAASLIIGVHINIAFILKSALWYILIMEAMLTIINLVHLYFDKRKYSI